jgi:hypothetical protein
MQSLLRFFLLGRNAFEYSSTYSFPLQQLFVRKGIRYFFEIASGPHQDKVFKILPADFAIGFLLKLKALSSQVF